MQFLTPAFQTGVVMMFAIGCIADQGDEAKRMIAEMDARPPEQRVPNWEATRAMMLREAPKVGEPAPPFTLTTRDGEETVSLSDFKTKKPVVLIFGSWT